jgi:hypothetical protein
MKKTAQKCVTIALLLLHLERATSVEFEKLGAAIASALKTTKAFKASTKVNGEDTTVFYSKGANGKANRFAVVQNGIYKPNCSHTWVVAVNQASKVEDVRVVEMSCTHAYPTRKPSFLAQFKGKGPAAVRDLASSVQVVAKATGSSELTRDAVVKSIQAVQMISGKF